MLNDIDFERILVLADGVNHSDVFFMAGEQVAWRRFGEVSKLDCYVPSSEDMWRIFTRISSDEDRERYVDGNDITFVWVLKDFSLRFRVTASRVRGKLALTFRAVGSMSALSEKLSFLTEKKSGLIILASRAGHGRTTLAYQLLDELARKNIAITTLEKNIEREIKSGDAFVMQRALEDDFYTLNKALRNALNSDVIFVEEADTDSIRAVLDAAKERLVILMVRASDTVDAITKIIRLGTEAGVGRQIALELSEVLTGCVTQELRRGKKGMVPCYEIVDASTPVNNLVCSLKLDDLKKLISNFPESYTSMERYAETVADELL